MKYQCVIWQWSVTDFVPDRDQFKNNYLSKNIESESERRIIKRKYSEAAVMHQFDRAHGELERKKENV